MGAKKKKFIYWLKDVGCYMDVRAYNREEADKIIGDKISAEYAYVEEI